MRTRARLTLSDLMRDKLFSLMLLLGAGLSEYLKSQLADTSTSDGNAVALVELALICFAAICLLRAADVLADQLSAIIVHAAIASSQSRGNARLAWGAGWLLRILGAVLRIAIAALVITISGIVISAVLGALGVELPHGLSNAAGAITPLIESAVFIAVVVGLIVGAWLVRGISYLLQARCQTSLG